MNVMPANADEILRSDGSHLHSAVRDPWVICRMQLPEYHIDSGDQVRLAVEKGSMIDRG